MLAIGLGAGGVLTSSTQVTGSNGNCTIPTTATAVSMNVTIIASTSSSFLTVFPSDKTRPLTANLNRVASQAPTPKAVTAALPADGRISFYNLSGTVNLTVDIVGYYEPANSGTGPAGVNGTSGAAGTNGADTRERLNHANDPNGRLGMRSSHGPGHAARLAN